MNGSVMQEKKSYFSLPYLPPECCLTLHVLYEEKYLFVVTLRIQNVSVLCKEGLIEYRAVNTLRLGFKNQSVNAV